MGDDRYLSIDGLFVHESDGHRVDKSGRSIFEAAVVRDRADLKDVCDSILGEASMWTSLHVYCCFLSNKSPAVEAT